MARHDSVTQTIVDVIESDPAQARRLCSHALASEDEWVVLAAGRSLDRLIDRDPMAAVPLVAQLLGRTFYEVDYDEVDELNEMLHRSVEPLVIAHDAEVQAAYRRALGHRARYVFRSRFPKR